MSDVSLVDEADSLRNGAPQESPSLADEAESLRTQPVTDPAAPQVSQEPWYSRFLTSFVHPYKMAGQIFDNVSMPLYSAASRFAGDAQGAASLDSQLVQQNQQQYAADKPYSANLQAFDPATIAGQVLNPVGLASTAAKGTFGNVAASALTAPLFAPAPDPSKSYWGQTADTMGLGGAVGLGLNLLGKVGGAVVGGATDPSTRLLADEGVTPTPGALLGRGFKRVEDALTSLPAVGDIIRGGQRSALEQFNQAAANRVLAPLGQQVPGNLVGHNMIDYVEQQLSRKYDDILPHVSLTPDPQFKNELANIVANAKEDLPGPQLERFRDIVGTQFSKDNGSGVLSGDTLQGIMSKLKMLKGRYASSQDVDQRGLSDLLDQTVGAMGSALERQNPAYADGLKAANQGWSQYVLLRRAASGQDALKNGGIFTPNALLGSVRAETGSKATLAKGQGRMQDLAQAGVDMLAPSVPDSGTTGRAIVNALAAGPALGAGYLFPKTAAALGAGTAAAAGMYSKTGRNLLASMMMTRPTGAATAANLVRRGTPALSGAALYPLSQFINPQQ